MQVTRRFKSLQNVSKTFKDSLNGGSRVSDRSLKGVSGKFQMYFKKVLKEFQGSLTSVTSFFRID